MSNPRESQTTLTMPPLRSTRARRWLFRLAIAMIVLLVAMELIARFAFGLGNPPLMMPDSQIEYLYQPSKTYTRLGHRISFNAYSMRSDDFPKTKSDPNELRIMFLGDSVINGGAYTDQSELATEIIKRDLTAQLKRPVVVGNISAASWGPPNLLAYVNRFGLFDADVIVIVLSSHDAADAPTFAPLGPDSPQTKPLFALQELAQKYLPRYLPTWMGGRKPDPPRTTAQEAADRQTALSALQQLLHIAQSSHATVILAQHLERSEATTAQLQPGHDQIADIANQLGVPRIELGPGFAASIHSNINPYRDFIHPNQQGQRIIAETILPTLLENVHAVRR